MSKRRLWHGVLLVIAAWTLTACRNPSESAVDPAVISQGKELYAQYCAECHGADLKGQLNWRAPDANGIYPAPPHDATGHTWHHPDALLLEIIANGGSMPTTAMPGFGDKLSEEEMRAVLTYIKSYWGHEEVEFQEEVTRNAQP